MQHTCHTYHMPAVLTSACGATLGSVVACLRRTARWLFTFCFCTQGETNVLVTACAPERHFKCCILSLLESVKKYIYCWTVHPPGYFFSLQSQIQSLHICRTREPEQNSCWIENLAEPQWVKRNLATSSWRP